MALTLEQFNVDNIIFDDVKKTLLVIFILSAFQLNICTKTNQLNFVLQHPNWSHMEYRKIDMINHILYH